MATGEGRRNKSSLATVQLTYPGKVDALDILALKPKDFDSRCISYGAETNNRFYFADNLAALATLRQDAAVKGKVRLVYIDPPYATQVAFAGRNLRHAYEDFETGPEYIESVRQRIILMHDLLADDGAIYIHIDERMTAYLRIVLDEVFGPQNFRNEIVRQKCNPKNSTTSAFGNITDRILFYTKSSKYLWNRPYTEWDRERAEREYSYVEEGTGRRFKKVPIHAPGVRNGATGGEWRGMLPPPGKHWQYTPETLDALDARGEIFWSSNGNPRRKIYFDTSKGVALQDLWLDVKDAHNQNILVTGYPTEKNPEILRRIIEASSNVGDIVLDAYAGSGTTLDVASSLGRSWIGIDNSPESLRTVTKRLKHQMEKMGDFVKKGDEKVSGETLFELPDSNGPQVRSDGPVPYQIFFEPTDATLVEDTLRQ